MTSLPATLGLYRRPTEADDAESQDQPSQMLLIGISTAAEPADAQDLACRFG